MIGGDLYVTGLSAAYARRAVIKDLTLGPIASGKVTALVGPNGAGKSTLLRALAGLIPSRGSARVRDFELIGARSSMLARVVTFVPQAIPAGVNLTVLEGTLSAFHASAVVATDGISTFASSRGVDAENRAVEVLEQLGIGELAMRRLDELSGGERQLAGLAQAVIRNPHVLLLDEPTSALDLRHQVIVMTMAQRLAADGRVVICALHDLTLAARWADEMIVMRQGQVEAFGAPRDAINQSLLARVYGIRGRVEMSVHQHLQIMVEGLTEDGA